MNNYSDHEEQIKESLKHMPEVKDDRHKSHVYQRISSEVNHPDRLTKRNRFAVAPVVFTVIAAGLLLLLIPLFMNDTLVQNHDERTGDHAMDKSVSNENGEKSNDALDTPVEDDKSQHELFLNESEQASYVISETGHHETIVRGAVTDIQGQYIIPMSLTVSNSEDKSQYYNKFGDYIDEKGWGVNHYMFSEFDFKLDPSNQRVHISLKDDNSLADQGSAEAGQFEDLLAAMFLPQINQVTFNQPVTMGKLGMIDELSLQPTKHIYKYYQVEESEKGFLIQIPIDDQMDFKTALSEMKKDEEAFSITGSVPEGVNFSVAKNESKLQIDLAGSDITSIDNRYTMMIEAILMTAKSFGYDEVTFTGFPRNDIGSYDLTTPVKVPEGVNPIIHE